MKVVFSVETMLGANKHKSNEDKDEWRRSGFWWKFEFTFAVILCHCLGGEKNRNWCETTTAAEGQPANLSEPPWNLQAVSTWYWKRFQSGHLQRQLLDHLEHLLLACWVLSSENRHSDFRRSRLQTWLRSAVPDGSCVRKRIIMSITLLRRTPPGSTLMRGGERKRSLHHSDTNSCSRSPSCAAFPSIFIPSSTSAPYTVCGIVIFTAAQSMLDPWLWERLEWKQIVCWHHIDLSFHVIMCRLLRTLWTQGCASACGLQREAGPYFTPLPVVSFQRVLSGHEYKRGLVFLVHVCGIVQALSSLSIIACVCIVHTRRGVAVFTMGMTARPGILWETCGSRDVYHGGSGSQGKGNLFGS